MKVESFLGCPGTLPVIRRKSRASMSAFPKEPVPEALIPLNLSQGILCGDNTVNLINSTQVGCPWTTLRISSGFAGLGLEQLFQKQ